MKLPWKHNAHAPKVLVEWIENAKKEGYSRDEIYEHLLEAGYTEAEIDDGVAQVSGEEPLPQELLDWLKNALKDGYSAEEVRNHLLKAGYKSKQVKQALEHEDVRRASSVWVGEDSSPKFKLPPLTYVIAVLILLIGIVGVGVFSQLPQKTVLWPNSLSVDPALSADSPVPLYGDDTLEVVLGFRRGEKHTLIVTASSPDGGNLLLDVGSSEIGSAQLSALGPNAHTFTFTPLVDNGKLTLSGEGDVFIHNVEFKRSRKLLG